MKHGYIHYWWFDSGYGPWIACMHGDRKHSASRMQSYHKSNGWPVSKMKTVRVRLPDLPKRMQKRGVAL